MTHVSATCGTDTLQDVATNMMPGTAPRDTNTVPTYAVPAGPNSRPDTTITEPACPLAVAVMDTSSTTGGRYRTSIATGSLAPPSTDTERLNRVPAPGAEVHAIAAPPPNPSSNTRTSSRRRMPRAEPGTIS